MNRAFTPTPVLLAKTREPAPGNIVFLSAMWADVYEFYPSPTLDAFFTCLKSSVVPISETLLSSVEDLNELKERIDADPTLLRDK